MLLRARSGIPEERVLHLELRRVMGRHAIGAVNAGVGVHRYLSTKIFYQRCVVQQRIALRRNVCRSEGLCDEGEESISLAWLHAAAPHYADRSCVGVIRHRRLSTETKARLHHEVDTRS